MINIKNNKRIFWIHCANKKGKLKKFEFTSSILTVKSRWACLHFWFNWCCINSILPLYLSILLDRYSIMHISTPLIPSLHQWLKLCRQLFSAKKSMLTIDVNHRGVFFMNKPIFALYIAQWSNLASKPLCRDRQEDNTWLYAPAWAGWSLITLTNSIPHSSQQKGFQWQLAWQKVSGRLSTAN